MTPDIINSDLNYFSRRFVSPETANLTNCFKLIQKKKENLHSSPISFFKFNCNTVYHTMEYITSSIHLLILKVNLSHIYYILNEIQSRFKAEAMNVGVFSGSDAV